MTILSTLALEVDARGQEIEAIMQRPLIVGASVSADWAAKSPGKLLALRYTDESAIKTIAMGGKSGREVLGRVTDDTLNDRTVVIGLDLFFWDATLKSPEDSLREMNRLMAAVSAKGIPIILGEVPLLLPGFQPQAAVLNKAMHKACDAYEHCTIVPFTQMLMKVLSEGALNYKGSRYGLKQLIPDGLHIGPIASQYIADTIYDSMRSKAGVQFGR